MAGSATLIGGAAAFGAIRDATACDTPAVPQSVDLAYAGGDGSHGLLVSVVMEPGSCPGPAEAVVIRGTGEYKIVSLTPPDGTSAAYVGVAAFDSTPPEKAVERSAAESKAFGTYAVTEIRTSVTGSSNAPTVHPGPNDLWDTALVIPPLHTITAANAGTDSATVYWSVETGDIPGFSQQFAFGYYLGGRPIEGLLPLDPDDRSHALAGLPSGTAVGICLLGSNERYGPADYNVQEGDETPRCAIVRTEGQPPVEQPEQSVQQPRTPSASPPPPSSSPLRILPPLRTPGTAVGAKPTPLPTTPPPPPPPRDPFPFPIPTVPPPAPPDPDPSGPGSPSPDPTDTGTPVPDPTDTGAPTPDPTDTGVPVPDPTDTGTPIPDPTDTGAPVPDPTDTGIPAPDPTDTGAPIPDPTDTGIPAPDPTDTGIPVPDPTDTGTPSIPPGALGDRFASLSTDAAVA